MTVGNAHVFPGFLSLVLTQLFFPKPPTTFLTCFCRGERRKYAGKKGRLNRGSNSQPPGLESDTLTTEPPWRGTKCWRKKTKNVFENGLVNTDPDSSQGRIIRITSVNSTNQASDVCRRTTSGSNNNNPHSNVNNMTTPNYLLHTFD